VREGVNGLFAATEDEWVERLASLLVDAPQRRRLSVAGRETVATRYSVEASLEKLLAAWSG
jgi:glycosyltransferase involved in cell wall biosynthesis